jgi:hypothetical protein
MKPSRVSGTQRPQDRLSCRPADGGYGWGVAEYATPEELFGYDFITFAYQRDPQESRERMMQHLSSILPDVSAQQLTKILKG